MRTTILSKCVENKRIRRLREVLVRGEILHNIVSRDIRPRICPKKWITD